MKLCCTYIETDKFLDVVSFYEKVFEIKGDVYTENRWVEFDLGNKLSIYNKLYDKDLIDKDNSHYNSTYNKSFNNIMVLNFYSDNLKEDYERIKSLNLCDVSDIMYVNITEPYYYFNISDPEGNLIEICGERFE